MINKLRDLCVVIFFFCLSSVLSSSVRDWQSSASNNRSHPPGRKKGFHADLSNYSGPPRRYQRSVIDVSARVPQLEKYLPRKKDLEQKTLEKLLGNRYDEGWLSLNKTVLHEVSDITETPAEIKYIDKNFLSGADIRNLNNETLNIFRRLLIKRVFCAIKFRWKDFGPLFWPPYIKIGTCQSKGSCSVPEGMKCVPDNYRKVHVLKWQCKNVKKIVIKKQKVCITERKDARTNRRVRCKWKRHRLRVLDRCICACRN